MHVAQQDPLLTRHQTRAHFAIRQVTLFGATENEGTGIARVVDDLPRSTVQQLGPDEFSFAHAAAQSAWEQEFLCMEFLDYRQAGSGPLKGLEKEAHRCLHLGVRIGDDTILRVVRKTDWHHLLELPAPGATQNAAPQSCIEHMQLRFAHCAL